MSIEAVCSHSCASAALSNCLNSSNTSSYDGHNKSYVSYRTGVPHRANVTCRKNGAFSFPETRFLSSFSSKPQSKIQGLRISRIDKGSAVTLAFWHLGRAKRLTAPVASDITISTDEGTASKVAAAQDVTGAGAGAASLLNSSDQSTREAAGAAGAVSGSDENGTFKGADESNGNANGAGRGPSGPLTMTVSVVSSLAAVPAEDWDACAVDAAGPGSFNPFLSHAFLLSLEESRSASKDEGWLPQHLVARDSAGTILGAVPLYLKGHSYGEYVFDHSWASAYSRFGGSYYPKLQACVPFTPATGPRIMARAGPHRDVVFRGLCQAMTQIADQFRVSSLHVTFPTESEWQQLGKLGFLRRTGMQYHWLNRNYSTFDEFLMDLKQGKRKNIRQERKKVVSQGLVLKRLRGDDIKPHHWDAFYSFYRNTTDQKWGQAYLTREFFHMMGERMGSDVLLVVAEDQGKLVGGALNLVGGDALYGRNWGAEPGTHYPFLHFEACYYQAIEAAIEAGLQRVEAGAQGEHKIQRGYLPTPTYSAHYIGDKDFREAIANFLKRETMQMEYTLQLLDSEASPFKDGIVDKLTSGA